MGIGNRILYIAHDDDDNDGMAWQFTAADHSIVSYIMRKRIAQ